MSTQQLDSTVWPDHAAPHDGHGEHDLNAGQHAGHGLPSSRAEQTHASHAGQRIHDVPIAMAQQASSGHAAHGSHEMHSGTSQAVHADHSGHEAIFRRRFWVCLLLSLPVLLYSSMLQMLLGFSMPAFPGAQWVEPGLATIIFGIGGLPFLNMARPELRNRQPGMMTLVSMAISVAFVFSLVTIFSPIGESYFWEMVTLIDIMLLGHWIEMRSVRQASGALHELARLMPDTAERIDEDDGTTAIVQVGQLNVGDLLLIRPGASIAADGEVVAGQSDVDEALITGESRPVAKGVGAKVIGGTVNGTGSLRVRVIATGDQTALAGIMRLVTEAQSSKSRTQLLADRAAAWLFYIALGAALITAVAWIAAIGLDAEVLKRVVTVLVIACPHALGLAIPLVVAITTSMSAQSGVLVRDRKAMENARNINTLIFDKTGTLTRGEVGVVGLMAVDGRSKNELLALAAAIEGDSEHMIARGIRRAAEHRQLALPQISDFVALKGRGVKANYAGQTVHIGGPRLLELLAVEPAVDVAAFARQAGDKGQAVIYLVLDNEIGGAIALADVIRPESKAAVTRLKQMGIKVVMLTGDSRAVAQTVAGELEIDIFFAEVLPEDKDKAVSELQGQDRIVAMVGDGVNDAPALTRADIGIAIGSGTDVAIESAGIILVQNNPLDVVRIIELSRASYRKMIQNLVWATGYNVVAIPLAAGILAPFGFVLSPAIGAVAMSLSTIIVALNAQLLRRNTGWQSLVGAPKPSV